MSKETQCKFCPAMIRFVTTSNGKRMPVNVERLSVADLKKGEVFVTQESTVARYDEKWADYPGDVFRPHFGNCPGYQKQQEVA